MKNNEDHLNDESQADHLYRPRKRTLTPWRQTGVTTLVNVDRKMSLLFPLALSSAAFQGMLRGATNTPVHGSVRAYTTGLIADIGGASIRIDLKEEKGRPSRSVPTIPGVYGILMASPAGGWLPGMASLPLTSYAPGCEALIFGNPGAQLQPCTGNPNPNMSSLCAIADTIVQLTCSSASLPCIGQRLRGERRRPSSPPSLMVLTLEEVNLCGLYGPPSSSLRVIFLDRILPFEPSIEGPWLRDRLVKNVAVLNKRYRVKSDPATADVTQCAVKRAVEDAGLELSQNRPTGVQSRL